jgi:hypothetical protein
LQEPQLHFDEEQEEEPGPAGAEEVLSLMPPPYGPQGSEVGRRQKAESSRQNTSKQLPAAYCLPLTAYWF